MADDKLQIYGFADMSWQRVRFSSTPLWGSQHFAIGNVNLYLRKNFDPQWRALTEVRLLFAPNGSLSPDGSYTSTLASDAANFERGIAWGGISIERVYIEYDVTPQLTIRAGRFLTPYGIWNIDHGSPTIIGAWRPYIVGEQFFPEHQTGIELFGAMSIHEYRLAYHATVSNGRNPFEATRDPDRKLAFGGRIQFTAPWAGTMQAGASAYRGRASESMSIATEGVAYDETALGADAKWERDALLVQAEVLVQQRRYGEVRAATASGGFIPDGEAFGAYLTGGYRFSCLWSVMPFAMIENYHPLDRRVLGEATGLATGLNFRPLPSLVFKAQYTHVWFGEGSLLAGTGTLFTTQAAWVF